MGIRREVAVVGFSDLQGSFSAALSPTLGGLAGQSLWLSGTTKTWLPFRLQRSLETEGMMQTSPAGTTVAIDETNRLISSDLVVGTAVYNLQGYNLGSIYSLMVDKITGQVGARRSRRLRYCED
jgi:hypothetical protein